jgi:gamma-glutamyl-gamma-aminobutyrate hydrolase PuuD
MKGKKQLKILILLLATCVLAMAAPSAQAQTKPVIGINCDVSGDKPREVGVQATYIDAITKSGGIALLLPPMSEADLKALMPGLDGVFMIGGDDYPPEMYGQKAHPSVSLMIKDRSDFDILLVKTTLADKSLPFLGVCAGCQALNIAAGGDLIQDIPSHNPQSKVGHASKHGWQTGFNTHKVTFAKGSQLEKYLGAEPLAEPTSHHQCVDKLGQDLKVTASSDDGLTEGIEMPDRNFVVGVQFHPERSYDKNQALFRQFIARAAEHRAGRK